MCTTRDKSVLVDRPEPHGLAGISRTFPLVRAPCSDVSRRLLHAGGKFR